MSDGIEIHYDENRKLLELKCEPDAFDLYRTIAKDQLANFTAINMEEVAELSIVDTATYVAKYHAPKMRFWNTMITASVLVLFVLAGIGVATIIRWITT